MDDITRISRLQSPVGTVRMVLDTDTANEIDDQFALVWALLSPERLSLEAIYAAPFYADWHPGSTSPKDGMEKSNAEILKVLSLMDTPVTTPVFKGSADFLPGHGQPAADSDAVRDLIERARQPGLLYVVCIGAITNVASAILQAPDIIDEIVVVWLGSHASWWPDTAEFNHMQDIPAARVIFDSGVPLIHVPCMGVSSHLITSPEELEVSARGSRIGDFLHEIVRDYPARRGAGWSKVVWDISTIAWLINEKWVPSQLVHSPIAQYDRTFSYNRDRHLIRQAYFVHRDVVFHDLFKKLAWHAESINKK